MKHLHRQFIVSSCGLGFGVLMISLAAWQAQASTVVGTMASWRTLSPALDVFVGMVLLAFGVHGIRAELNRAGRK